MSQHLIPYIAVVEIEGEQHIMQGTGVPNQGLVRQHLQQIHPDMKIISFEKADIKDPLGHLKRVKASHEAKFPGQEPLTPARLNESANAAIEQQNAEAAEKLA